MGKDGGLPTHLFAVSEYQAQFMLSAFRAFMRCKYPVLSQIANRDTGMYQTTKSPRCQIRLRKKKSKRV